MKFKYEKGDKIILKVSKGKKEKTMTGVINSARTDTFSPEYLVWCEDLRMRYVLEQKIIGRNASESSYG